MRFLRTYWVPATVMVALLLDQILKFWIKTNMYLTEEFLVLGQSWFRIHFIENEGMAFGLAFGGATGKVLLTLFRIAAVVFIGIYLRRLIQQKAHWGMIASMTLILSGAIGNIIDSVFYGVLFSASPWPNIQVAAFLPEGGGYAPLLQGKVVDMFFFPIIYDVYWPEWLPLLGGREIFFFRPVFNLADSYITIGVFIILLGQKRFFRKDDPAAPKESDTGATTQAEVAQS